MDVVGQKKKKTKNDLYRKDNLKKVVHKKPTHLFLNDKFCTSIENIPCSSNLSVIYLHNNSIRKIENLDAAVNLRCLYLQNNKISKIENLSCLINLKKLYLGHNEISVIEGLENLTCLEELHIEKQRLDGDSLCFDSRSITAIASSLLVLSASHNNITTVANLIPLRYIKMINLSYNYLRHINEFSEAFSKWSYIYEINLIGNPITKLRLYRETLISYTSHLVLLDNKEISSTTRSFMKQFEKQKMNKSSLHSINSLQNIPSLAKNYSLSVQKAICQSIVKNTKPCFDNSTLHSNVDDIYLPWKALPQHKKITDKVIPKNETKNEATGEHLFSTTLSTNT